jgi:hypothetical protein
MSQKSHFVPRTRRGRRVVLGVLFLYLLIQWPVLTLVNRIEPFVLGMPLLFGYLLAVYIGIIAVMIYAARKGL